MHQLLGVDIARLQQRHQALPVHTLARYLCTNSDGVILVTGPEIGMRIQVWITEYGGSD